MPGALSSAVLVSLFHAWRDSCLPRFLSGHLLPANKPNSALTSTGINSGGIDSLPAVGREWNTLAVNVVTAFTFDAGVRSHMRGPKLPIQSGLVHLARPAARCPACAYSMWVRVGSVTACVIRSRMLG